MKKILLWLLVCWLVAFAGCRRVAQSDVPPAAVTQSAASVFEAEPHAATPPTYTATASSDAPLSSAERAWKRPLLYQIEGKGAASYLFGTIHLPDRRLDLFPPELRSAIDQSDVVFTEIPLDEASQRALAPRLVLPQGQTLETVLPESLYRRLNDTFAQQAIPFAPFERMKPWAVSVQVAVLDRLTTVALNKPVDALIHEQAIQAGRQVRALETVEEQISIFDRLSRKEQVELLQSTLEYRDSVRQSGRDALEELLEAYLAGDTGAILKLVHEAYDPKSALSRKLMKQVFSDRNKSMSQRIAAELRTRSDLRRFFAVGSGHLLGDDGIVARLQQQGFRVIPVAPGA